MGGESLRKSNLLVLVMAAILTVIVLAPGIYANPGGVGSKNLEYDCGGSCHDAVSTSVITMSATNTTPAPGGAVTVTVTVSGGEASDSELGVMIVSATTYTNSQPSADGWAIVADPSGSTMFNYYEVQEYSGSVSLSWDLTAPSTLGVHVLFAREMHGGPGTYANDYATGLVFTVTDYSAGGDGGDDGGTDTTANIPTVWITSPSNAATVSGNVTINANIVSVDEIVSATLKIDGTIIGELTSTPFSWTVDTTNMTEGGHTITVTVVDSTGDSVSKEIAVFVDNESELVSMLEWVVTIGAGAVTIVCVVGMMVVLALYIRKRVVERRSR